MSGSFKDEVGRASKFREILQDSGIDISTTKIAGTKFKTDSDIQSQGFRPTIIEAKNKVGSKGAQPHAQGILYYIHSTKSSVTRRPGFIFPYLFYDRSQSPHSADHPLTYVHPPCTSTCQSAHMSVRHVRPTRRSTVYVVPHISPPCTSSHTSVHHVRPACWSTMYIPHVGLPCTYIHHMP